MLFFLVALISFLLQLFLPWWIIGPVAFALCYYRGRSMRYSFVSSFLAVSVIWTIVALTSTLPNGNLLANRIGDMLNIPAKSFNWIPVLLISSTIGGLAAGFSGMAGYYVHMAFGKSVVVKEKG